MKKLSRSSPVVLLCWSGGLDSTRLACEYLDRGYTVHALAVPLLNNPEKHKREEAARQAMMAAYFKNFDFKLIRGLEIKNPLHLSTEYEGNAIRLQELPYWMFALVAALRLEHDEVAIGYVANDTVTASFREQLVAIWESFNGLAVEKFPPLKFPLFERDKRWVYETLPQELRSLVTWCNGSGSAPSCNFCPPCKLMTDLGLQPNSP